MITKRTRRKEGEETVIASFFFVLQKVLESIQKINDCFLLLPVIIFIKITFSRKKRKKDA